MENQSNEGFRLDGPAIVEVMGHKRLAGYISEVTVAGAAMLRIDVLQANGRRVTQIFGGAAIYCITPTTEEAVRALAQAQEHVGPVAPWEMRSLLPANAEQAKPPPAPAWRSSSPPLTASQLGEDGYEPEPNEKEEGTDDGDDRCYGR